MLPRLASFHFEHTHSHARARPHRSAGPWFYRARAAAGEALAPEEDGARCAVAPAMAAAAAGDGGGGPEEGVGESSSPPRDPAPAASGGSGGGGRGGGLRDICREVFERLVSDGHAAGSELLAQLEAHFNRLPIR